MTTFVITRRVPARGAVRRLALAGAASVLAVAASPANAADESAFLIDTTADLARLCAVTQDNALYAAAIHMCHGYLLGVHHFHEALAAELDDDIYCEEDVDPTPTRDEAISQFIAWVGANPQVGESEALDGVLTWAAAAFPCAQ